ncbi:Uncharacterised protein [Kingella denitrificans]|uniref:Uncharacterized protein n=1 Tax=Kingella denitrificans ATCC 33394 TaxID=888741 RepID=F0F1Y6_9NEIS|nr:hypothetical protein [Kingella denitrificans]EGC16527.1 hypothetical protein HMPREF9098_2121 [Kingella denitrificans ATCC 33394]STR11539.1 Uncharacterised protein [Kingella denitrificans]
MPKPTRQDFAFLNDAKTEAVLFDLYTAAVRQIPGLIWHFLPQLPKLLGKGSGWTGENEAYFDDKYIPIVPQQGAFLYIRPWPKARKTLSNSARLTAFPRFIWPQRPRKTAVA